LRSLPPGRYAIESVDRVDTLTEEEEAGILAGLTDLDAGRGIPLADVVREIIQGGTSKR
jgi:predicted transcriptional regulator